MLVVNVENQAFKRNIIEKQCKDGMCKLHLDPPLNLRGRTSHFVMPKRSEIGHIKSGIRCRLYIYATRRNIPSTKFARKFEMRLLSNEKCINGGSIQIKLPIVRFNNINVV